MPDTCLEVAPTQEENACSMLHQMQPTDLMRIEGKHRTQGLQDTPYSVLKPFPNGILMMNDFTSRTHFYKCYTLYRHSLYPPYFSFFLKKAYGNASENYITIAKTLNVIIF